MKPRKTKINTRQVVVNHIDANIIVKQQNLIAEYERFNEQLLLMLHGDAERHALKFSDDILGAFYILERVKDLLIKNKKDGE